MSEIGNVDELIERLGRNARKRISEQSLICYLNKNTNLFLPEDWKPKS